MTTNFLRNIVVGFCILTAVGFSQEIHSGKVVKIGAKSISEKEFLERYEFTPGLRSSTKSETETAKLDFLYSLIAEKLWAEEASLLGMDTLEVIRFAKSEFEKMFVRDALFRKEILDKIKVSPVELEEGYQRNNIKLYVNFIFSEDDKEINKLYSMLKQGVIFDSVLVTRAEYSEQKDPIEIVYGQMGEFVEDSLYKLDVDEYTEPLLTPDGWYIFKLVNRSATVLNLGETVDDTKKMAEEIIRARKSRELYLKYYQEFFKDKKVDVDPELFENLATKISERFVWQKSHYGVQEDNLYHLLTNDVIVIENEIGLDTLNKVFVKFDKNPLTLKQYFRTLAFNGFSADKYDVVSIRKLLDTKTRQIIEYELLAREGIKKGYNLLPEVLDGINMWTDNYLYQNLQNKFLDSVTVTEDEIFSLYKRTKKEDKYPRLYNICEILTDSLATAEMIMQKIKDGQEFRDLAKMYTMREWTKGKGGEFGFFPASQYGDIGKIASTLEVGQIYGPLKVPEGYSIFKLIDKRDSVTIPSVPFEKVKEQYRKKLRLEKARTKMINYTADLAIKFGVAIDFDLFNSIEVTSINSLAIRRLGFGGQITAVPIINPNFEWVQPWLERIKVIQ